MFQARLEKIIDGCKGAVACCVMGYDGVSVSTLSRHAGVDVQHLSAEFSFVLAQVRKAADVLEIGPLEEVVIRSNELTYVVRTLSPDYFVGLVIQPQGNLGKGRYLLRQAVPALREHL